MLAGSVCQFISVHVSVAEAKLATGRVEVLTISRLCTKFIGRTASNIFLHFTDGYTDSMITFRILLRTKVGMMQAS